MFIIVMGVAGAGKTTVGIRLAAALGWRFYDADDFHPEANISKMAAGIPLDDRDRLPWVERLRGLIGADSSQGMSGVLACSALRGSHRELLRAAGSVAFVYLRADRELIGQRLRSRQGHYMPADLMESQFGALEEPEEAIDVDASLSPDQIVALIRSRLGL